MDAATESELLSDAEKRDLTGFTRGAEQARWLQAQGVPHRLAGRRVIVSRVHVRKWLEGAEVVTSSGPNWDAPGFRVEPDLSKVR